MFEERLKALRKEHKMSQKALAEKMFVSQQAVARWESTKEKASPNPETLARLAQLFGVSVDYLLGKTDIPDSARTAVNDDDIKFALFGTTDIDDATLEDIKAYARFKREQYNNR